MFIQDKIFYAENFLTSKELTELDQIIEDNTNHINKLISNSVKANYGSYVTFEASTEQLAHIANKIYDFLIEHNFAFRHFYARNEIQFTFNNSEMSVHVDGDGSGKDVGYGVVVYLSDPTKYNGGEIYYPDYDLSIKPARGSLAIHAGDVRHGVKPITGGNRYVLVAFTSTGQKE